MPLRSYSVVRDVQDSVVHLPVLDVVNSYIYPVLDTIIALNNKCIHVAMGESTWFNIKIYGTDTLNVNIYANQYVNSMDRIKKEDYGIFYYKNSLFVVSGSKSLADIFFTKTEKEEQVITYYPNALNYLFKDYENSYSYYQSSYLSSCYINDHFIMNNIQSDCIEYYPVYHKIKRGDTMEKVSKLYWVTPEQIIKLNNLEKPILPDKGVIRIQ